MEKELASLKFYDNLINESSNAIYVNDVENYELLYINLTAMNMIRKQDKPYKGEKCYKYFFNYNQPCKFCKMKDMQSDEFLERDVKFPLTDHIYCLRGKLMSLEGVQVHVEYIQDVTENREMIKENILLKKQAEEALDNYQTIVNTVPGAIVLYEVEGEKVFTKYYSEGLCVLSGFSREERDVYNHDAMALIYDEDVPKVQEELRKAIKTESNLNLNYRIKTKKGVPHYINLRATYLRTKKGKIEFHAVFSDMDDLKRLEEQSQEQELRYEVAVKSSGMNVWEYDIQKDSLIVVSNSSRIKQNCFVIHNYIQSTVDNGYVREDSLEEFYNLFKRLKAGEKEVVADIWYKTTDELGFWCERVIYTSIFDEYGTPIKAFGAGRDVTREKEAEARFKEETNYREAMQYKKLTFVKMNLSKNKVISEEKNEGTYSIEKNKKITADEYIQNIANNISGEKNKEDFEKQFNRNSLLNKFNTGEFAIAMDCTVSFDNRNILWINYSLHLMQNSENKDIIAYMVSTDITDEKVMQTIMETVSKTDYDLFVVVNGKMDSALDYAITYDRHLFEKSQSFESRLEEIIRQDVCKEDVERVVSCCKIKNIMSQIKNGDVYKFNFSIVKEDGTIRRKQLQFTLIDIERSVFLMTRIDVNNIYIEQQKVQRQLQEALESAKKASKVKSEFLSRMSHDMRTPMNGIIGLTNLSRDIPNLPEEMRKNLEAIDSSGKYLLSLINDTLDMNKIESNKITFNPEVVAVDKLIHNILTFLSPMVQKKRISMEYIMINAKQKYIRIDKMRVEQIFTNILSNAIKFTPDGGKIHMEIECLKNEEDRTYTRISIEDNGIGMSKEFLPKIFEPFTQESSKITTNYEGTGLGLSIVKNFVELMGGNIEVESELGKGTKVSVFLSFEIGYEDEMSSCLDIEKSVDFGGKQILLCEDHPLNAQIAKKLLQKKGMIVCCAGNGEEAINILKNSEEGFYDAVLMDIRMPVMDGLEATRNIRALNRKDSRKIPIIAMTANAFEEDIQKSKEVGMNAHLAKPIEPEKLYKTLAEFL